MAGGAQGWKGRMVVENGSSLTTGGTQFNFLRENVRYREGVRFNDGIDGDESRDVNQTRDDIKLTAGSIWFHPTPNNLDTWLEIIMGGTKTVNAIALTADLSAASLGVDLDTDLFQWANSVYVNKAVFSGRPGGFLECRLDVLAGAQTDLSSWPGVTVTTTLADQPYNFEDSVLTLNSNAHEYFGFRLTIDNNLEPRFVNSLTPNAFCRVDKRTVDLDVILPFETANELALYSGRTTGITTNTLAFTNSTVSTTFTFGTLRNNPETPSIPGKREIVHQARYRSYKDSSDDELAASNDSTV